MRRQAPARWMERLLLWCLPPRDRETISGDLLEEYREEQLPRLGWVRADVWYLRQAVSFVSVPSLGGWPIRGFLTCLSLFTAACGVWLAAMENIQRHAGYPGRSAVAACIAMQGLATALCLVANGRLILRAVVLIAAAGAVLLGASAVKGILDGPHFEGFALLIGSALIVQGSLTLAVLRRS